MTRTYVTLLALALGVGCVPASTPDDDTGDDDIIDDGDESVTARAAANEYVTAVIRDLLMDIGWVSDNSHGQTVGWAVSAHGAELSLLGSASMMFPCDEPVTYDGYCDVTNDELGNALECLRVSCLEAGVWRSETWFADASAETPLDPETRHPFTLSTTAPSGTVHYDENPLLAFVIAGTEERVTVTSTSSQAATLELADGTELDVDYSADLSLERDDSYEPLDLGFDLEFPSVLADGPLTVTLGLGVDALPTGTVQVGGETAGTVEYQEGDVTIVWTEGD